MRCLPSDWNQCCLERKPAMREDPLVRRGIGACITSVCETQFELIVLSSPNYDGKKKFHTGGSRDKKAIGNQNVVQYIAKPFLHISNVFFHRLLVIDRGDSGKIMPVRHSHGKTWILADEVVPLEDPVEEVIRLRQQLKWMQEMHTEAETAAANMGEQVGKDLDGCPFWCE